ncbi:MAG: chitobiase/beta-hexosaminidase C-terminal domain-containing protein [Lachnospiraceae bacterium]|nr:chitobiase/beta-hexosaminidase C-terminal domain-containing protein [Lachnospiraceae bacterium]
MKCPHCGNEMIEGHLICEKCGEEIRIVPDFEPEIENSITETLSILVAGQDGEDSKEEKQADLKIQEEYIRVEEPVSDSRRIWVIVSLVIFFIVALVTYSAYAYHIQTVEYQIDKAREYAAKEAYEEAIACLETAITKNPLEAELLFMEADYYYIQKDDDSALQALFRIIENNGFSYEDVEEAYNKVIAIYANQEQYGMINDLLKNCQDDSIVNMFQSYMAMEPEFSYVEGDYAEVIPLKLSSNTSGTIYYTLDGSRPDKHSQIYTAPLFLEDGEHTISAFFVNDYGIESEVVTRKYVINLSVPNAPEVELYSGEYTEPMMIIAEGLDGCKIYYTTDGSEPTADSVPYTGPIPMPLGRTQFKFVNISDEGVSSEVIMRTYTLALEDAIPTDQAVANLIERLVETGYLEDSAGNSKRHNGTLSYQFSSVLGIGGSGYYTINEYYDDGTGILSRTDKVFLIQIHTGEAAQLGYDEEGEFVAVPI